MDKSCPKYDIQKVFSGYNQSKPNAYAQIKGGPLAPCIKGTIYLYQLDEGVYIKVYITGIPNVNNQGSSFHGLHIHEVGDCSIGNNSEPFTDAKSHYNPSKVEHPMHAGDLPPLFENKGYAYMNVLTDRFTLKEVIGKAVVIHSMPDDFTSQPSGNSGEKIACGIIK